MACETIVPVDSAAQAWLPGSSFHDAWTAPAADPSLPALGQFLRCLHRTPAWVERCMALRNRVVAWFGLKDLGGLSGLDRDKPPEAYRRGDRVGIFTLLDATPDEATFGIDDRHLDVRLAVHRRAEPSGTVQLTVTTVVKVHNLLGRLYMLPVRPMHRLIAPTVLDAVARK